MAEDKIVQFIKFKTRRRRKMKHYYSILYKTYLQYLPAVLYSLGRSAGELSYAIKFSL